MRAFSRRHALGLMAAAAAGPIGACAWRRTPARVGVGPGPRTPLAYLRTNWSRDPFALGSYSYVSRRSPGTGEADRAALEAPIDGRVFFAGEALNPNYASTVHAAHESGLRAVEAIGATDAQRVAIVGGGMAGLTAAAGLAGEGVAVSVLEARDRLGGRIHTDASLGVPMDLGASWIHGPEGNPITAIADRVGMERVETDDSYAIRGSGGRKIGFLGAPLWLAGVAEATSLGASLGEINRAYLARVYPRYGVGYSGGDVKFPNGYAPIFKAFEGDYEVRLSAPVQRVALGEAVVDLTLGDGAVESFDAVLVTVPLGVLKAGSITFEPALSAAKLAAIDRMGMGVLDKLYLRFEEVFWDDEGVIFTPENGLPRGHFNYWFNLHRYFDVPILMAFNAAEPARELAGSADHELIEMARRTLESAYPVA